MPLWSADLSFGVEPRPAGVVYPAPHSGSDTSMRFLAWLLLCWSMLAGAAPVQQPHVLAELLSERPALTVGTQWLGLRLTMDPEWHTYWRNPGDSGMPTQIRWTLPAGISAGEIQWPVPERIAVGPLVNHGYSNQVLLLVPLTVSAQAGPGPFRLSAQAEWLVCKENCLPGAATFELTLPLHSGSALAPADPAFADARRQLPQPAPAGLQVSAGNGVWRLSWPGQASQATFFVEAENTFEHAAPQPLKLVGDRTELPLTLLPGAKSSELRGLLHWQPAQGPAQVWSVASPVGPAPAAAAPVVDSTLPLALLLALLGGVLLNAMPCVFPVLGLKILGVLDQSGGDAAALRRHGLWYGLGVVASCCLLAAGIWLLRGSGTDAGWGYQLQSPTVVALLAGLFFLLALNLSGVFELGAGLAGRAASWQSRRPELDALGSGLLAVVVATPCTAPFMGTALGFALTQEWWRGLLVFAALGVGIALPYVLLTRHPGWLQRLPKPGPWMDTLKKLLAFPLYAAALWLVWVLGRQHGVDAMAAGGVWLLVLALAAFVVGQWATVAQPRRRRVGAWLVALTLSALTAIGLYPAIDGAPEPLWRPYSAAALAEARQAGHTVFVDFTAAWCVTCQVNKRLVLNTTAIRQGFERHGVVALRADWTLRDAAIARDIAALGRPGVPTYAVYHGNAAPQVLPELLTSPMVLAAVSPPSSR